MTPEGFRQVRQIFEKALELPRDSRSGYVRGACREDSELLAEVERMVEAAEDSYSPIDRPALLLAANGDSADSATASDLPAQIGHYRILKFLGKGGMGFVYRAEDLRLGREVALKFLLHGITDQASAIERFRREARAAAAINHPNICTVYEIGEHENLPYIAMELLQGETVEDKIKGRPIPLRTVLDWAIQIADALEAAHEHGIVHRDLKPTNLFITKRGQPKILDFGLAKLRPVRPVAESTDRTLTATTLPGYAMGTPAFMSPEQVRGEELDARSDLFSFGIVLYQIVTRRRPFNGANAADLAASVLRDTPESPIHGNPELPRKLDEIIAKTLEKDRDIRYQSAADLVVDLKRLHLEIDDIRPVSCIPTVAPIRVPKRPPTRFSVVRADKKFRMIVAAIFVGVTLFSTLPPGRSLILRKFFWPAPFDLHYHPWADDFSHDLIYWDFPQAAWRMQTLPQTGAARSRKALLVKSSIIGVPNTIGPETALYDFEFDMRARFLSGDRISWALRVQNDRKRAYVFELQKRVDGIEFRSYVYPGRKLIPSSIVDQTIIGCCKTDSALLIHSLVENNKFNFWIKLEATPSVDDTDSDVGKSFRLPTVAVDRPRYPFGNIGLLETEAAGAMLVEYVQVSEIRHHDL